MTNTVAVYRRSGEGINIILCTNSGVGSIGLDNDSQLDALIDALTAVRNGEDKCTYRVTNTTRQRV